MSVTVNPFHVERAMTPVRFFGLCGVVLALGCSKEKSFVEPSPPLAAITWANVVPDTGQVDMRVIDMVSNAGFFDVNFRDALTFPQGIEAGQREIRVFMSSTNPAISQTVLLDTTYLFAQNGRYGFYVSGFARAGQARAVVQAVLPLGSAATSTQGAIAGSLLPGSVLTAIIVPRAVPGSAAPQTRPASKATDTTVAEASRRIFRSNDTVTAQTGSVTIVTRRPDPKDATKLTVDTMIAKTGTGASAGVAAGDVILVSGTTQPEYNGWQGVLAAADTLICGPSRAGDTATLCAATADTTTRNDTVTTRFRFRYRIVGTPVSPGTGTVVYRLYAPAYAATDFVTPQVVFVVDKRP